MKRRFLRKVMALTLLLIILQSTFLPHYLYALTTGPHQPEYTSYEEPGATDLVNLVTGDFTFSLPILDVPSPEGGFSVPLTYNAGIGLEQEASWVGLGWTLNVGAITRQYTGFPDDASGETQSIAVKDLTGVRGWTSSVLGLGNIGWNSQVGHYGQISLLGLSWDKDGAQINPIQLGLTILSIVTVTGALSSLSQASVAASGATALQTTQLMGQVVVAQSTLAMEAVGLGMSAIQNAMAASQTPVAPSNGYWKYSKRTQQRFLHKNYWIWLDKTRYEDMYGALYLQKAATKSYSNSNNFVNLSLKVNNTTTPIEQFSNDNYQGSASDINYYMKSGESFENAESPATLALDEYSVKAPGVSGSIQPYRLDIGSVSMPRKMSSNHNRLIPIKYQDYKVPFVYKGMPSNNYYHHVGAATSITTPSFYDNGLTATQNSSTPSNNTLQTYNFNDIIFGSANRIRSDVNTTKKVPQANHVVWHNNDEIEKNIGGFSSGFIDYFTGSNRISFRQNAVFGPPKSFYYNSNNFTDGVIKLPTAGDADYFIVGSSVSLSLTIYQSSAGARVEPDSYIPEEISTTATVLSKDTVNKTVTVSTSTFYNAVSGKSVDIVATSTTPPKSDLAIGGYAITGADGLTYHFAMPVYDYNSNTYIVNKDDPKKNTTIKRLEPFANTWLLTAITGPDFIDRSSSGDANGIVDESDWGYWVKFNYSLYSNDYKWRSPFSGSAIDAENTSKSYSEGQKQTYYLNSIETRSHVALFFKDIRKDNRDADPSFNRKSLLLNEINLVTKEVYNKLISDYGFPNVSGVTNRSLMVSDINASATRQNFLYKNTAKRIKFTHTYSLCQGTPNSENSGGKLTLDRVSILGRSDLKITPDYVFTYGSNPNFGIDKWDGWGMYNPVGDATHGTHKTSENDADGTAWSLTKVTTPFGSDIAVDYERDSYSSVAGVSVDKEHKFSFEYTGGNAVSYVKMDASNCDLKVGDQVRVKGTATYPYAGSQSFDQIRLISSVIDNKITFSSSFLTKGSSMDPTMAGTLTPQSLSRKGGSLRVKMLTYKDGSIEKKIRYLYTEDGTPSSLTSGVVAQEPDFINNDLDTQPANVNVPGFPMTPIMYKKVTVLSGNLSSDSDYHTREVYEFETPDQSMISVVKSNPNSKTHISTKANIYWDFLTRVHNKITDYTSKIGSLKSISVFDKAGVLQASTLMNYTQNITSPQDLGVYSEGTVMLDRVGETDLYRIHKMSRTTVLKYPNMLKSVITSKDGFTSKTENLKWDLLSTKVLEKLNTGPGGLITKSVSIPAYTVAEYSELGSKALSSSNKNMLSQEAAQYEYRADANGNATGLISANITTWKKNWNYRVFNPTTGFFEGSVEGANVWRKSASYTWRGDMARLKTDGTHTFTDADKYNFTSGALNSKWQFLGESSLYNHFNISLESRTFNNIFSSTKMGYDNRVTIAQANNAEYGEIAFSGGEDYQPSSIFFGGEVGIGNGTILRKSSGQTSDIHTGDAVVKVSGTGKSFIYKTKGVKANKFYKSSVWTNATDGRIYLKINGVDQPVSQAPVATKKVGNWYLLTYEFKTPASVASLEVGVMTVGVDVLFDDFRFQPSQSVMTCYVFDPLDFFFAPDAQSMTRYEYVLDNDNFFTKYEYNERGQLVKTYVESIKLGGVKLVSESKTDYKRFHTNQ